MMVLELKRIGYIVLVTVGILACRNNTETIVKESSFDGDTVLVENDYPPLTDPIVLQTIQKLRICSNADTNSILPACDASNFRIFPVGPDFPTKKGFILEMNEGVHGSPVKQVMVLIKSFNKFKIVNRYLGFLIEYRTSESGYNDLLLGYKDPEMGLIGIRHEWDKENYQPVDVEEINGYFIKPEFKDSINHLFLSNFNAGY